jgi:hypothetical protein
MCGERGGNMGKGTQFVGHPDGVGGLVIPDEAVTQLSGKTVPVDGIAYPFVVYKGRRYPGLPKDVVIEMPGTPVVKVTKKRTT